MFLVTSRCVVLFSFFKNGIKSPDCTAVLDLSLVLFQPIDLLPVAIVRTIVAVNDTASLHHFQTTQLLLKC